MEGVVVEVYKNFVKVHSQNGEKIIKMRGAKVPPKGWILEFRKEDPSARFVGSVVVDSPVPLPSLQEAIPIIETAGVKNGYEIDFLAELTRNVYRRLGFLPKWYYRMLGKYYRVGEDPASSGVASRAAAQASGVKKSAVDELKVFGRWLSAFSHPLQFISLKNSGKNPTRIFIRKKKVETFIRIEHDSKSHGRVVVEGVISPASARLKVISEKSVGDEPIEKLQKELEKLLGSALVVKGGLGLGSWV